MPSTQFMTCGTRTRKGNGERTSERYREVYKAPRLQLIRRRSGSWSRLPNHYVSVEDTRIIVSFDLNTVYKAVYIKILTSRSPILPKVHDCSQSVKGGVIHR